MNLHLNEQQRVDLIKRGFSRRSFGNRAADKSEPSPLPPLDAGLDEALEQGMGLVRFAAKFGMKLRSDEEGMVRQFNHLDQLAIGTGARDQHAMGRELLAILVVELVAVPVPLLHLQAAVRLMCLASLQQHLRV